MKNVLVFAAVALLALTGCGKKGSTADAVRFNDGLVASSKRVADAAKAFGDAVGPAVNGGIQEVSKAKRELETVNESFERAQSDVRLLKVPDSSEARAFLAEHQKLLKHQEQLIREEFAAVVKVLEDPLLSARDRAKRIVPIANYIRTMDQGSSDGIKKAQAAFAKAHGFQLK
jgi:dsDNA-specific endonuclease/ATPase MutS2